jgi:hypothetical protein
MASAAPPTPEELYAALRELHPGLSDEKLAREVDIGLKTLQRLKAGHGTEYLTTVYLLKLVGWLNRGSDAPTRAQIERLKREAQEFARAAEEIAARLP